jgi:hypothetical protein
MFPSDRVQLRGETAEFALTSDSGNRVTRVFCPRCGSPILGRNTGMPGFVTLSLGAFEDSSDLEPEVAIFTRSRRHWDVLADTVQSFERQPGWRPTAS